MTEKQKLCNAVDKFAEAMKRRLLLKHREGYSGWDINLHMHDMARRMLLNASRAREHRDLRSLIDTANLAMMIWYNKFEK